MKSSSNKNNINKTIAKKFPFLNSLQNNYSNKNNQTKKNEANKVKKNFNKNPKNNRVRSFFQQNISMDQKRIFSPQQNNNNKIEQEFNAHNSVKKRNLINQNKEKFSNKNNNNKAENKTNNKNNIINNNREIMKNNFKFNEKQNKGNKAGVKNINKNNNIQKNISNDNNYNNINEVEELRNQNKENKKKIEELEKELDLLKDFKEIYELEIKKNPMIIYKAPTLVGLNNIGATCFMNATLECLSQTKNLTNYFLNKNNLNNIINNNIALENENKNQLSPVYLELIQNLWKKDGPKAFDPTNFMNKINDMNSLFKKGQPGDSKDFIIYILEQLHKELKKPIKINNINNISEEEELNQYDKNNTFKHFFNDFQKDCSIISDLFFGIIETNNECLNCKNNFSAKGLNNPICYNYQIFNCLIFPLAEVYNMKINVINSNNNIMNSNSVTLNDCFCYYTSTNCFNGENRNFCNICHQLSDSFYTTRIYSSPNVLIIILNRGKDNIYNIKLDFGEIIDITQFVLEKDMPEIRYELYGVITHIGESGPNAHFIASCKSPINKKWYRFNDAFVDPINNIQKEILDYGIPYILFYQKKDY